MTVLNPISYAIELVGLQPLARAVGVSYQAIRKFEQLGTPAERVIPVARATGWRVTPHQLRPDLYPNEGDAMPAVAGECAGLACSTVQAFHVEA